MMSDRGAKDIAYYMFASNSRTRADRASKLFGYEGKQPSFLDTVEADMKACCD